ncbi:MAG: hypothetical protein ABI151_17515 [Chitinophagaceae bacterium]
MRSLIIFSMLFYSVVCNAQLKSYLIGVRGDTLNKVDSEGRRQGKWVIKVASLRGEAGWEEEGVYIDDRKEGGWRKYSAVGDILAIENMRWGYKDGLSQYFSGFGQLLREEKWKAINPEKKYDTVEIENVDNPGHYKMMILKNEGAAIRNGLWKTYDPVSGLIIKTENFTYGVSDLKKSDAVAAVTEKKSVAKPKEVLDFEKKNAGKKKIKVKDGSTGL